MTAPLLRMEGIWKKFGAIQALKGVSLDLNAGEALALVGDNAAGKSTLMKVLSGAVIPDSGQLYFDGRQVTFRNPLDARRLGIEMVYQDLALCDSIDVGKNLFLGREPVRRVAALPVLDEPLLYRRAQEMLAALGIESVSVRTPVKVLSGGQRQAIAIARAVSFRPRVLILDEPTAALAVREVDKVLDLVTHLKTQGVAIIYITHRLQDIFRVCDRVMIMFEGEKVAERRIGSTTLEEVVRLIVRAA
jgi:simple sugar transport system ATP-binding protein